MALSVVLAPNPRPPPAEEAITTFLDRNGAEAEEENRLLIPAGPDFSAVGDDDVFDGLGGENDDDIDSDNHSHIDRDSDRLLR